MQEQYMQEQQYAAGNRGREREPFYEKEWLPGFLNRFQGF